jgi:hypothetical protein
LRKQVCGRDCLSRSVVVRARDRRFGARANKRWQCGRFDQSWRPGGSRRRADPHSPIPGPCGQPVRIRCPRWICNGLYIYRGTTLSDHRPAAGAAVEATAFGLLYAGSTIASVKLPSQPAAEITMSGGVRPKLGNVTFDFGLTYFLYPGESPPPYTSPLFTPRDADLSHLGWYRNWTTRLIRPGIPFWQSSDLLLVD